MRTNKTAPETNEAISIVPSMRGARVGPRPLRPASEQSRSHPAVPRAVDSLAPPRVCLKLQFGYEHAPKPLLVTSHHLRGEPTCVPRVVRLWWIQTRLRTLGLRRVTRRRVRQWRPRDHCLPRHLCGRHHDQPAHVSTEAGDAARATNRAPGVQRFSAPSLRLSQNA